MFPLRFPRIFIAFCIFLYQKTLSFDHGVLRVFKPFGFCRFYPSCSEYSRVSILRFGIFRGFYMAFLRILRCHPFSPGGLDPVPDHKDTKKQLK
jgi:putative membrane protein insertion efficiency factor